MQEKYDGGTAFPTETMLGYEEGMTLRDYFAAKALQGLLSRIGHDKMNVHDVLAQRTYAIADAMLEAREQK
jgi:hypothetical protein